MKLEEKIQDRKIVYCFKGELNVAFELALLYFILAKRKKCRHKITNACSQSVYWLKKSGAAVPAYLEQLSCFSQLEEIEKLLVLNKNRIEQVADRLSEDILILLRPRLVPVKLNP